MRYVSRLPPTFPKLEEGIPSAGEAALSPRSRTLTLICGADVPPTLLSENSEVLKARPAPVAVVERRVPRVNLVKGSTGDLGLIPASPPLTMSSIGPRA